MTDATTKESWPTVDVARTVYPSKPDKTSNQLKIRRKRNDQDAGH